MGNLREVVEGVAKELDCLHVRYVYKFRYVQGLVAPR